MVLTPTLEIRAIEHLVRVNGWPKGDAETCIEVAFETWHRRSTDKGTQDITRLGQRGVMTEAKGEGYDAVHGVHLTLPDSALTGTGKTHTLRVILTLLDVKRLPPLLLQVGVTV